ncbi:divalent-cation tolerance protein CutA [Shewanella submarina]|uniref:Divalent-cation tolerance protein CutA n=1 Tax=Shewanella submarina TaxID=2016376 RepID=A0ABV7GLY5_9GAMM|nr:divalent-cation tolerance protein CutA [Shewanella submarina]MCL1035783.1 divalent-cation tolerance protein CutA [Shewanella submarina]
MQYDSEYLLVLTTCPSKEEASALARTLVEQKLAACVQISAPITSCYSWDGKVCEEQEFSLQIKCLAACYDALQQAVIASHPYEVPELIAVPVSQGLPAYLEWIKENSQS